MSLFKLIILSSFASLARLEVHVIATNNNLHHKILAITKN